MAQIMFCQSYDPPKVSMPFPKKIETAVTTAVTAVVDVYYIKKG